MSNSMSLQIQHHFKFNITSSSTSIKFYPRGEMEEEDGEELTEEEMAEEVGEGQEEEEEDHEEEEEEEGEEED